MQKVTDYSVLGFFEKQFVFWELQRREIHNSYARIKVTHPGFLPQSRHPTPPTCPH